MSHPTLIEPQSKYGVLFVGLHGMTASTFLAAYHSLYDHALNRLGSYWYSNSDIHYNLRSLRFAGWDHRYDGIDAAILNHGLVSTEHPLSSKVITYRSLITQTDYAHVVEGAPVTNTGNIDGDNFLLCDVQAFKMQYELDKIFIVNLSSPMPSGNDGDLSSSTFQYRNAALLAGADWVEFTPSPSIDDEFIEQAENSRTRVMGRDGSTGQTILKLVLRDYFQARGLNICDWYSTNLIGNHDGLVLQDSRYNETKMDDKKSVLDGSLLRSRHTVDIAFHRSSGDNKESWDCVHFTGWNGSLMSLRLNWHGADSFLAGGLLLDIIMSLIHANELKLPFGLLRDCDIFFKAPYGEPSNFADQMQRFRSFTRRR